MGFSGADGNLTSQTKEIIPQSITVSCVCKIGEYSIIKLAF
jgi:hypothetical protein